MPPKTLITEADFNQIECLLSELLIKSSERETEKLLQIHNRIERIYLAQKDQNDILSHLRSLSL